MWTVVLDVVLGFDEVLLVELPMDDDDGFALITKVLLVVLELVAPVVTMELLVIGNEVCVVVVDPAVLLLEIPAIELTD